MALKLTHFRLGEQMVYVCQCSTPFRPIDQESDPPRLEKDIPKSCKFYWDTPDAPKQWSTRDASVAVKLLRYADAATKEVLDGVQVGADLSQPRRKTIELRLNGHEYVARSPTDLGTKLLKEAGFEHRMAGRFHEYYATDCYFAQKLMKYADDQTRQHIVAVDQQARRRLELSRAMTSDRVIPFANTDKHDLYPFQRAGVDYADICIRELGFAMITDQMGLGKSPQGVCVLNMLEGLRNVLIICPAPVKYGWKNELKLWGLHNNLIPVIVDANGWPNMSRYFGSGYGQIVLIHPHVLHKWKNKLDSTEWDIIIIDEAHRFLHRSNRWSKMLMGGTTKSGADLRPLRTKRRLILTGTPIRNRVREMFTLLHYCDPLTWDNFEAYKRRYCKDESRLPELNERLRRQGMIRREMADVMKELPPLTKQLIELELPDVLKIEEQMLVDMKMSRKEFIAYKLGESTTGRSFELAGHIQAIDQRSMFKDRAGVEQKARKDASLAVVPNAIEILEDVIDNNKVLYFFHHREHGERLLAHFGPKAGLIYGEMSVEQKESVRDRAWTDNSLRLVLMSVTMAEGINLQCIWHMIFGEPDYVPGVMDQAAGRCLRIGQDSEHVLAQYFVPQGSILADIMSRQLEKARVIYKVLDEVRV